MHRPFPDSWRFAAPVLWFAAISTLSTDAFSAAHTGSVILPALQWLLPHVGAAALDLLHTGIRKTAHLTAYGIFAVLWYRAVRHPGQSWQPRALLLAVLLPAAFASVAEFHQRFVPSRGASVADVGLDTGGPLVGLSLCAWWERIRGRAPSAQSVMRP